MTAPLHGAATVEPWELTRAVAAFDLPDGTGRDHPRLPDAVTHRLVDTPLDAQRFSTLLRYCQRQRLTGLLQHAVEQGALPVHDEQRQQVADRHLEWCSAMLGLDRELLRVVGILEDADIEVVVLKGTSSAHLHYPEPGIRLFGDNDVLLRGDQIDAALSVLTEAGYSRPKASARPDFDRRFGKGATLVGPERRELDVHRNLVFGSFGFAIDMEELWASTTTFTMGGRQLRVLGREQRLLHACYHAALGDPDPRLSSIRDLAQQARLAGLDVGRVLSLADRWRARVVVARGLALVRDELGVADVGPLGREIGRVVPTATERRAIASYVDDDRSFSAKVRASLPYLSGLREGAAFLRAVVLPDRSFTATRGAPSLIVWWQRGARSLIRGRSKAAQRRRERAPARVLWLTKGLGLGGAERLLTVMAPKLDAERFELEVAYLLPWKDAFVPQLTAAGVAVHCLGAKRTVDPSWVWRLSRLLRRGRFDIVHTHAPVPAAAARLLAPRATRFVHTEHNVWERYRAPTRLANAWTFGRNALAFGVSDGVTDSIDPPRWALGRPPIAQTLLHGVDADSVQRGTQARAAARQRLQLDAEVPVVGTVANLTPKKDQATLLAAIDLLRARVPDVVLCLIGSGPLEQELQADVRERGLDAHVRFLGSRDDVPELLPAFDVFTLSSRYEGLPISMLEAMAAEVAVVVTAVGGIPEAITDHVDGRLVPAGDPRALADAYAEVLGDPDVRVQLAAAGRSRVVEAFSIDRAVTVSEARYRSLLG